MISSGQWNHSELVSLMKPLTDHVFAAFVTFRPRFGGFKARGAKRGGARHRLLLSVTFEIFLFGKTVSGRKPIIRFFGSIQASNRMTKRNVGFWKNCGCHPIRYNAALGG
jgi:hypothetical protein